MRPGLSPGQRRKAKRKAEHEERRRFLASTGKRAPGPGCEDPLAKQRAKRRRRSKVARLARRRNRTVR